MFCAFLRRCRPQVASHQFCCSLACSIHQVVLTTCRDINSADQIQLQAHAVLYAFAIHEAVLITSRILGSTCRLCHSADRLLLHAAKKPPVNMKRPAAHTAGSKFSAFEALGPDIKRQASGHQFLVRNSSRSFDDDFAFGAAAAAAPSQPSHLAQAGQGSCLACGVRLSCKLPPVIESSTACRCAVGIVFAYSLARRACSACLLLLMMMGPRAPLLVMYL